MGFLMDDVVVHILQLLDQSQESGSGWIEILFSQTVLRLPNCDCNRMKSTPTNLEWKITTFYTGTFAIITNVHQEKKQETSPENKKKEKRSRSTDQGTQLFMWAKFMPECYAREKAPWGRGCRIFYLTQSSRLTSKHFIPIFHYLPRDIHMLTMNHERECGRISRLPDDERQRRDDH